MRPFTTNASNKSRALVEKIVNKIEGLTKPRKYFMISIIILYLSMRSRYTFKGMERYGAKCEKTYRLQFEQRFDFLSFNVSLRVILVVVYICRVKKQIRWLLWCSPLKISTPLSLWSTIRCQWHRAFTQYSDFQL